MFAALTSGRRVEPYAMNLTGWLSFSMRLPTLLAIRCVRALVFVVCTTVAIPATVRAQAAPRVNEPACLRYTFGPWTPALDWKGAGHVAPLDSTRVDHAPGGRSWAAPTGTISGDTILMLYPSFWPVGIALSFDPKTLLAGDTANVKATAFVADARVPSPVSRARVWRVQCQ